MDMSLLNGPIENEVWLTPNAKVRSNYDLYIERKDSVIL